MSFSFDVKSELFSAKTFLHFSNRKWTVYGIFFENLSSNLPLTIKSENTKMLEKIKQLINLEFNTNFQYKKSSGRFFVLRTALDKDEQKIKNFYKNVNLDSRSFKTGLSNFLLGLFLTKSTLSDPTKDYLLAFKLKHSNTATLVKDILTNTVDLSLMPNITPVGCFYIVSINQHQGVRDFLTFIGAQQSVMDLIQVKMIKESRNQINRSTNFETANITKTATSAATQLAAIKKLIKENKFDSLSQKLKLIAKLRLKNQDLTLAEMAKKLNLSKSGTNHRLNKIIKISEL